MNVDIFKSEKYVSYLNSIIGAQAHLRGFQSRMAEAAGCHRSQLSSILKGNGHLSIEQALGLANFLNLTPIETEYYLTMVQVERAGTSLLKKYFENKLDYLKRQSKDFAQRIQAPEHSVDIASEYFSNWHWLAIHIACAIPQMKTYEDLSRYLNLDVDFVKFSVDQLVIWGLLKKESIGWSVVDADIHLPEKSPLVQVHHTNWRSRALAKLNIKNSETLHYTSVSIISQKDADVFREKLMSLVLEFRKDSLNSPCEIMYALTLDWFKV